jgi:exopolysaccharide biosynthesis polyprenyl glycosylphosphotransferase
MIRRHVRLLRLGLMTADALSAFLLFGLVVGLRFEYLDPTAQWIVGGLSPEQVAAAYGVIWVGSLWLLGLYRLRTHWSLRGEVMDVLRAAAFATVTSMSLLFLLKFENISRLFVLILLVAQPLLTVATRMALRLFLGWLRSRGYNSRQMLIVGSGKEAREFAVEIERQTALGLRVIGHLAGPGASSKLGRHPVIGTIDEIEDILHSRVVDEVAICLSPRDWSYVEPVTRICEEEGKIVRVSMRALGGVLTGGRYEQVGETPLVTYLHGPDRVVALTVKRLFDILLSSVALMFLGPVMVVIAAYIRLADGSPVLFRQTRVGLHGREFTCLKFRTMARDAEQRFPEIAHLSEVRGPAFKMTDDPRITPTGRWLRRTSLDELPQLINVLRGEMSIVGPRPALTREVAGYSVWHRRRLAMRPGITGLWQVEARGDDDFDNRAALDLRYIDRWSVWMDVKIMMRTIPAMMQQQGR